LNFWNPRLRRWPRLNVKYFSIGPVGTFHISKSVSGRLSPWFIGQVPPSLPIPLSFSPTADALFFSVISSLFCFFFRGRGTFRYISLCLDSVVGSIDVELGTCWVWKKRVWKQAREIKKRIYNLRLELYQTFHPWLSIRCKVRSIRATVHMYRCPCVCRRLQRTAAAAAARPQLLLLLLLPTDLRHQHRTLIETLCRQHVAADGDSTPPRCYTTSALQRVTLSSQQPAVVVINVMKIFIHQRMVEAITT